ncbi:MAG: protein-methionine-sulfoxide reductase catalytic subunit MsrP [Acidimicrobiia bacterium]|nr:protein-methionine-sulfoxide reductase catalytic subunit MsrP [Acidimicrobiia bacterium]
MLIRIRKGWEIPEREATPEHVYLNRRQLLRAAGLLAASGSLFADPHAAKRNPEFTLDRPITPEWAATGYNNFYEFHPTDKQAVKDLVGKFKISPWKIEVKGLVNKPQTLDLDDLLKTMPMEERLYRFRCVEAWSMAVPWTGFPMSELIKKVQPKEEAKYLRFVTALRPEEMPGVKMAPWYKWPYYEGLTIAEAMNPLAMFVTGMYGKQVPKQNGAPFRVIVPWKYGYKSPKSIVTIEFASKQPKTFWNDSQPREYGFYSNVNPSQPHPRWSQAHEKVIPTMQLRPTLMYNGYEKWVTDLYNGDEY